MTKAVPSQLEISGKAIRCVAFEGIDPVPMKDHAIDYMHAERFIQEAGYEIRKPYGAYMSIWRGVAGDKYAKQNVPCEVQSLVGMALASSQDEMISHIDAAFDVFEESNAAYAAEMESQRSARKRGRHALGEDVRRSEFAGSKLTKDLKEWADSQPEGISELIFNLLMRERDRREANA